MFDMMCTFFVVGFLFFSCPKMVRLLLEVATLINFPKIVWIVVSIFVVQTMLLYRFAVTNKRMKVKKILDKVITFENVIILIGSILTLSHQFWLNLLERFNIFMKEHEIFFYIVSICSIILMLIPMLYVLMLRTKFWTKNKVRNDKQIKKDIEGKLIN